ncbi:MAG: hypothetical protein H6806_11990 [Planctomycetes bacterium]|nr:hypothetical protein [Planctomycetota bacterium]MCB9824465.1 hypothetical protein [Planctomycetota bacterium]MCB9830463.1 hypothetical protein [Planctomycetota bacterium]MCB9900462.1 hypothetical protein [Planctomycetota bacterium]
MKTSKPLFWRALLIVLLVAIPPGCGAGGGKAQFDTADILALFFAGDPSVQAGKTEILFTVGGAPSDGSVQRIDPSEAEAALLTQGLDLFFLEFLAIVYELGTQPVDLDVTYDLFDALDDIPLSDADMAMAFAFNLPVYEAPDGTFYMADEADLEVAPSVYRARDRLFSPIRFGIVDTGFRAEVEGTQTGDVIAYTWGLEQTRTTIGADYKAEIYFDGSLVFDLGTFPAHTLHESSASFTVPASELAKPLELRLTSAPHTFWRSFTVSCKQELDLNALPAPRVYDAPFAPEAIDPVRRDLFEALYPSAGTLAFDEFGFATAGADLYVAVARSSGLAFGVTNVDLGTGEASYGIVTVTKDGPNPDDDPFWQKGGGVTLATAPTAAARVLYGAWGISIADFDHLLGAFETHTIQEAGNITDVCPFDGNPEADRLTYVSNSGDAIKFIETDTQDQYALAPGLTVTNGAWTGASGRVVSAFRHPSGDLLFITDGEPGELWVMTPGATTATKIADTYDAPRRVRCAGNIVAVGCYGSALGFGGLRILVRGPTGTYTNAPFSRLGARSVGIDAKELSGGRVAIATTGFLTNNLIVTIVDGSTGEILDDQVIPLPAGCTGPGHCAFVRDAGVDGVFVTCNTSNQVVLMPVNLDP